MRHTNFDNVVRLFEQPAPARELLPTPKGPVAPATVPSTRRPSRPKRVDAQTGHTIPVDCYDWVAARETRAGHWRVNARRLAEWRASLEPTAPAPVAEEPVAPAVEPVEPAPRFGLAERVMVGAFHLATFYGVTSWFLTVAPMVVAIFVSTLIVGTSFLLLEGAFARASAGGKWWEDWRRWTALALLALVGIYGSAATWRADLAGEGADSLRAREAHSALEARIYRPLVAAADAAVVAADVADRAADAAEGKCDDEQTGRGSRPGYGPEAKRLCAEARNVRAAAGSAHADADAAARQRDALAPYFGAAVASYTDAQLHAAAVSAAGVAGIEPPARGLYVEPALLVPALRAAEGEAAACFGFGLALGIDFVGIVLLGTAISHRRRH